MSSILQAMRLVVYGAYSLPQDPTTGKTGPGFRLGVLSGVPGILKLPTILRQDDPVRMFTNSRKLFDSIITLRNMTEKWLFVDIGGPSEAFGCGELANIA